jgi:acyl-[acyl-carrier-protein]-phospholipid O-acyltransferase/long-chain-fatty-acid--[acyl-carrier-protein] ligase
MDFIQALLQCAKKNGLNTPLIEDSLGKHSLKDVFLQASAITLFLSKYSIKTDSTVGVIVPNVAGFLSTSLACSISSIQPAFINYGSSEVMIDSCIGSANIDTLIVSRALIERINLTDFLASLKSKGVRIIELEEVKKQMTTLRKLHIFLQYLKIRYRKISQHVERNVIFFTSGSEAKPKVVVLTEQKILENCAQVNKRLALDDKDIILNPLPLFHCFGFTLGLMYPIVYGYKLSIAVSPIDYRGVVKQLRKSKATILLGTNTLLKGYLSIAEKSDLESLKTIFSGGEALSTDVVSMLDDHDSIKICEGYGATEASPVIAFNAIDDNRFGTVGKLLNKIESKLVSIDGFPVGGELVVRGPNIMKGYLGSDGISFSGLEDGWYRTGDICVFEDGYLKIIDRIKRFAKIGGEMISLTQLESVIKKIWPEDEHAAISTKTNNQEVITLFTTNTEISNLMLRQAFKKSDLPIIWVPKSVILVSELNKLSNGKIDYISLKKRQFDGDRCGK